MYRKYQSVKNYWYKIPLFIGRIKKERSKQLLFSFCIKNYSLINTPNGTNYMQSTYLCYRTLHIQENRSKMGINILRLSISLIYVELLSFRLKLGPPEQGFGHNKSGVVDSGSRVYQKVSSGKWGRKLKGLKNEV